MDLLLDGLREAWKLLVGLDPDVMRAAWRSVWISSLAVSLAAGVGIPFGLILARKRFPGRRVLIAVTRALMAVPTVFVGLVCYGMFARRGPLGPLDLLYSPWGIVVGELLLALPIVVAISHGAVRALDPRIAETARTLGAGAWRRAVTYLTEVRLGITLAFLTAFARCVTELGIAMMVGGNIKDRTRTLATATALEAGKGEFARGLAMGFLLLAISLAMMSIVALVSREERE
jgi:tungstate transport system permease protein